MDLRPDLAKMVVRNLTNPAVDPQRLSLSSNMRLLWRCLCGEEFEAYVGPAVETVPFICRLCRYPITDQRLLDEFVMNLKNPGLPLSRSTRTSSDQCIWRCRECGDSWEQTITNRASKRRWNCPSCSKLRGSATRRAAQPERSEKIWSAKFQLVEAYIQRTGSANVPNDHVENGVLLGAWVQSQRDNRKRLDQSHIDRLEGLSGWQWQRSDRGLRKLADERPDLAAQWHPDLNDRTPADVSVGSAYLAVWRGCQVNTEHVWTSMVRWRVKSPLIENPCLICTGWQVMAGVSDLATTHPELAAQWHPTLNNRPASSVGYGSAFKAWWTNCPQDNRHVWRAAVENRTKGSSGCTVCLGKTVMPGVNDLATLEPEIASEWHPELNAKEPHAYSQKSNAVVYWLCKQGHVWRSAIANRQKSGCGICGNRILLVGFNDLATLRPDLAQEWDYSQNAVGPADVLVGSHRRASWICQRGHSWQIAVVTRTSARGSGCPVCAWKETSPEQALFDAIGECSDSIELRPEATLLELRWKRSNVRMKVDLAGVLISAPQIHVAIEYDGSYYHFGDTRVARDIEKTLTLLEAGYLVVRIREQTAKHNLSELPLRHPRLLQLLHPLKRKGAMKAQDVMHLVSGIESWLNKTLMYIEASVITPTPTIFLGTVPEILNRPAVRKRGVLSHSGRLAAWNRAFGLLEAYTRQHGSPLVPQRYVTEEGFWLGSWVKKQRARREELPPMQQEMLETISGWRWAGKRAV